jgi:signal transduction histidine kinase/ActR/RegA family two-component response regulator
MQSLSEGNPAPAAVADGPGELKRDADAGLRNGQSSISLSEDMPSWLTALQSRVLLAQADGSPADLPPILFEAADALWKAGFAPHRVSLAVITMHPGLSGLAYIYDHAKGRVGFFEKHLDFLKTEEHLESPFHFVMSNVKTLFLDCDSVSSDTRFPIMAQFVEAGATSYLALPVRTARGDVHTLALTTNRPGGWSAAEAAELALIIPLITVCVEVAENRRLLGIIGTHHEVTQRVLAERTLTEQKVAMERLEAERDARRETERLLAERNAELAALAVSLEAKVLERTKELEEALERANAATEARSRFLAMVSHEIRTPMHGILGFAELLAQSQLDLDQIHHVETIHTTGKALLSLLNSVLDFSKLEAGRIELERFVVDPGRLLDETATLLSISSREKGINLNVRHDVPSFVEADPTRLRQVWMNLLGNAVKFTETGTVQATLEVASFGDGICTLKGTVRDTGPGIPPKAMERLFEPFTQADGSMARRFGGSGLGLTISKGLLEQMDGSLSVESEIGVGSTFTFLVPVRTLAALPKAVALPQAKRKMSAAGLEGLRVLCVDDNPINRQVAARQLKLLGVTDFVLAEDGLSALEKLQEQTFDVVLLDVQMPHIDGHEVARRLRKLPLTQQPRVIAMTANCFEADRIACSEAGMDDFLPKPVSIPSLKDALLGQIRRGLSGDFVVHGFPPDGRFVPIVPIEPAKEPPVANFTPLAL